MKQFYEDFYKKYMIDLTSIFKEYREREKDYDSLVVFKVFSFSIKSSSSGIEVFLDLSKSLKVNIDYDKYLDGLFIDMSERSYEDYNVFNKSFNDFIFEICFNNENDDFNSYFISRLNFFFGYFFI